MCLNIDSWSYEIYFICGLKWPNLVALTIVIVYVLPLTERCIGHTSTTYPNIEMPSIDLSNDGY